MAGTSRMALVRHRRPPSASDRAPPDRTRYPARPTSPRRRQRPAMHPADPARREHPDPCRVGRDHRRRDRRRRPAALAQGDRHRRPCGFAHRARWCRRQRLERLRIQPHEQPASRIATVAGTALSVSRTAASDASATSRFADTVGRGDQRRLERDHGPAVRERRRDLGGNDDPLGHGRRDGHAAAYRRRYPAHMPARRPMTPEDIRRVVVVEELDLSTDGRLAIVVRRSIKGDRYHGHLFAIDLERSASRGLASSLGERCATPGRGFVRMGRPLRSCARTPPTRTPPRRIALLDLPRPGHARSLRPDRRSRGRHRARLVTRRPPPRLHRGGRPAQVHRRTDHAPQSPTPAECQGNGRDARAASPAHHPHRLALGRRGPPRSMVAPVRRRLGRWAPAPGHERRLGRVGHRLASGRSLDRLHRRPRPRRRPPSPDRRSGPSTSTRPRSAARAPRNPARRAARDPRRPRLGQPPGVVPRTVAGSRPSASSTPSTSTTSCPTSSSPRPTARARRTPSTRTSTARSAIGRTPTSTAGWLTAATGLPGSTTAPGRHRLGPRSLPSARLHDRFEDGPPARANHRRDRRPATTHTIAVAPAPLTAPPRIAFLATNGQCKPWTST